MNRVVRRRCVLALVVALLTALSAPLSASAPAGRSENLRLLTTVPIKGDSTMDRHAQTLAFRDDLLVVGVPGGPFYPSDDPGGFSLFRILDRSPYLAQISSYTCGSGADGAIAVWDDYVFMAVDDHIDHYESETCNNRQRSDAREMGLRIVDISEPSSPHEVAFVPTSSVHNLTLMPQKQIVYVYVPTPGDPTSPAEAGLKMRVIRFDPRHPKRARVVSEPLLFAQYGCHDLAYYAPAKLAACVGVDNALLLDVSDPPNPRRLAVLDIIDTTHQLGYAAFSWDGRYLAASGSETMGVVGACGGRDDLSGVLWLYDVSDPQNPQVISRFSPPRVATPPAPGSGQYNCDAWRPSFVPTRDGRYIVTMGWSAAGFSAIDFSVPDEPREIAQWSEESTLLSTGHWYNGRVYGSEMNRAGIRVFEIDGLDATAGHEFRHVYNPTSQILDFVR